LLYWFTVATDLQDIGAVSSFSHITMNKANDLFKILTGKDIIMTLAFIGDFTSVLTALSLTMQKTDGSVVGLKDLKERAITQLLTFKT